MATRHIVVIGAGAAGTFTCHELSKVGGFDITLLEALDRVGGNAQSVNIPTTANPVDVGPQFFSPLAQLTYTTALKELGLWTSKNIVTSSAGVTVYNTAQGPVRFHVPQTLGAILEQMVLQKGALEDWIDFSIATLSAILYDFACKDQTQTVDEWLAQSPQSQLPDEFKHNVLVPFLYQFIVVNPNDIKKCSAYFTLTYYAISVIESIIDIAETVLGALIQYFQAAPKDAVLTPPKGGIFATPLFKVNNSLVGLDGILEQVLKKSGITPSLNAAVTGIAKQGAQWSVQTASKTYLADHVVFACHPNSAATILEAHAGVAQPDLLATLNRFPYVHFAINMQTPPTCYLPPEGPSTPREAVNIMTIGETIDRHYQFTVDFHDLRPGLEGWRAFKSWGNPSMVPPSCASTFFPTSRFGVLPTADFMQAQQELAGFQGRNNLWFAGGYTNWYDSQEAAVRSANSVSQGIAGTGAGASVVADNKEAFAKAVRALERIDKELLPLLPFDVSDERKSAYRTVLNQLMAAAQSG